MHRFTQLVVVVAGVFNVLTGAWAFFAPVSFFERLAVFPPYNEHFLHDVGAFQIGLGVALLAALRWSDAVFVSLLAVGTASVFHFASHVMDAQLGGRPTDFVGLGLLAAIIVAATVQRSTRARQEGGEAWHASRGDREEVS